MAVVLVEDVSYVATLELGDHAAPGFRQWQPEDGRDRIATVRNAVARRRRAEIFAVAQGNADVLISEAERMNILFSLSTKLRNDRIQVSYLPSDLAKMGTTPVDPASMEAVLNHPAMSPERAKAVRGMLRLGFSPVAVDLDSMLKRIFMRNSTTETAYDGVTVEFTWFD